MASNARRRVLVVGGRGFLGRHALAALERAGVEASAGGRGGPVKLDLARADTFGVMRDWDAIVDCGDSVRAPPDAAIAWCLEHGVPFVETAAEPVLMERLLALETPVARAPVLLGAGIFPGISNLVAARAAELSGACRSVALGISWSPLSAGGAGMVRLVDHLVRVPTRRYQDGAVVVGPPAEAGPRLPFPSGERSTLHLPFSEASMLAKSTGAHDVGVYAGLVPKFMQPLFRLTPPALMGLWPMRMLLRATFTIVRRVLLSWHASAVELVAVAEGDRRAVVSARTEDGIGEGGAAIAAMTLALLESGARTGIVLPDEIFDLASIAERANALADPDARLVVTQ